MSLSKKISPGKSATVKSVMDRLKESTSKLTPKQRVVAKYVEDNIDDLSYLSTKQIARATNVSEASITRFVYAIGYDNFAEFQRNVRTYNQERHAAQGLRFEYALKGSAPSYRSVFSLERSLMDETLSMINDDDFNEAIKRLADADEVLVVACSPHDFITGFVKTYMGLYLDRVFAYNSMSFPLIESIDNYGPRTTALVFSFPRYPRETQKVISALDSRGVYSIGITDSVLSPIIPYMDRYFLIAHKYMVLMDPYAALMSLIHSFIVGIYKYDTQRFKKKLRRYEATSRDADVFVSKNLNLAEMF